MGVEFCWMELIGLISDTHDYLDPKVPSFFRGVSHIIHAGDVGRPRILLELEQMAPVTAVLGNTDYDLELKEREWVEVGTRRILVHHIVDLPVPEESLATCIRRQRPDAVVFGHTHKAIRQTLGGVLYINPGYAGRRRAGLDRSVALLECHASEWKVRFLPLDG